LSKKLFNFSQYTINEIITEIDQLEELLKEIYQFTNFINLNLTSIQKLLKNFDKKFNLHDNAVALNYLKAKLSDSRSNLVYILQFKLIDETSALVDRLLTELRQNYNNKKYLIQN
jgi:SPX domain protein involved in polyphosphate accumulation